MNCRAVPADDRHENRGSRSRWSPAPRSRRPSASPTRRGAALRAARGGAGAGAGARGPGDALHHVCKEDRERSSIEFERSLAPALAQIADARVRFASQSGGVGSGRRHDRDARGLRSRTARTDRGDAGRADEGHRHAGRAADQRGRQPARAHHRARAPILPPSWASPPPRSASTIRIATMGEIEQNAAKFSLSDRQIPIRVKLPEISRESLGRSRTCRSRPHGRTVPLAPRRRDQLRLRAHHDPALQPEPPGADRRRSGAGGDQGRRAGADRRASGAAEPAAGRRPRCGRRGRSGRPRCSTACHRDPVGLPAGLRGAGAALQALDEPAGQHDLAAARPAGRHLPGLDHRPAELHAGLYRHAVAAGNRLEELDPADRFRDRGDGRRQGASSMRSSMPGTSARSRSS